MSHHPLHPRRIATVAVVIVLALAVSRSDALNNVLIDGLNLAEGEIRAHPRAGALLFLGLAGLSAMLAFFSSAALVPIGVYVWGKSTTCLLLWSGWTLGGVAGYWIARTLGRRVVGWLVPSGSIARYERFAVEQARWPFVLLFQVALPSEIPSYVLGLVRYPFVLYLAAVALGEFPFAAMAVYLGQAFVERQGIVFGAVLLAGLLLSGLAWRTLHRRVEAVART
jgi:uncharacterized membrane protein YdjX (TVP38/TMEM64 family)